MKKTIATLLLSAFLAVGAAGVLSSCSEESSNVEEPNKTEESVKTEKTGEFYSLQEAYDNGYLTMDDLKNIAYYYNGVNNYEDFTPYEIGELDEETALTLKQDYCMDYKEFAGADNVSTDNFSIEIDRYYGTYNDCVVASVNTIWNQSTLTEQDSYYTATNSWWVDITIEDVTLSHVVHNSIKVWKKIA